jgi:hypothetical protein
MDGHWSEPIDLYCERTNPSFWAEPVNAWTNAAFLLAAAVAFVQWQRNPNRDLPVLILIVITGIIGIGSFAFHTLATRGAVLLDVIPIALFVYGYLLLALWRFLKVPAVPAIMTLIAFIAVSRLLAWALPDNFLNGSGDYLLPLAALLIVGFMAPAGPGRSILLAAAVFAVSLVFRSIDQTICAVFPLGTHFIWHLLNAVVLFVLLQTAMVTPRQPQ